MATQAINPNNGNDNVSTSMEEIVSPHDGVHQTSNLPIIVSDDESSGNLEGQPEIEVGAVALVDGSALIMDSSDIDDDSEAYSDASTGDDWEDEDDDDDNNDTTMEGDDDGEDGVEKIIVGMEDGNGDDGNIKIPSCAHTPASALLAANLEDWVFSASPSSEEGATTDDPLKENTNEEQSHPESLFESLATESVETSMETKDSNNVAAVYEPTGDVISDGDCKEVVPKESANFSSVDAHQADGEDTEADPLKEATPDKKNAEDEEMKEKSPDLSPDREDFFKPSLSHFAPAERKIQQARKTKEQELEALRNRKLAGRKTKELKKTINKNLRLQLEEQQQHGNTEWRKVGGGDADDQDGAATDIQIGTVTTTTTVTTSPPLQQVASPASVTSPTMAYEELAMEQQKEKTRQREMEKSTMIQNQLHPESNSKKSQHQKLLEIDFVFGLLVGQKDPPPDMHAAAKAAAKIVPNMLTTKKTIYYDPRYPPKVAAIEIDQDYALKAAAEIAEEALEKKVEGKLALQKRYMIRGKVPVLPTRASRSKMRRSNSSSTPQSHSQSTSTGTSPTIPTTPLSPSTVASNLASNSASSSIVQEEGGETIPTIDIRISTNTTFGSEKKAPDQTSASVDGKAKDLVGGPATYMSEEFEGCSKGSHSESSEKEKSSKPCQPSRKLPAKTSHLADTRSSSTDIKSIRLSKQSELEDIRQRSVAKQRNKGFTQLEHQSALSKAAYEAEQQDLEQRRSNVNEYHFLPNSTVNPHDQLFLQQNKQNRTYREIQQKTRDEYHRIASTRDIETKRHSDAEDDNVNSNLASTHVKVNVSTEQSSPQNNLSTRRQSGGRSRFSKLFRKGPSSSIKNTLQEDETDKSGQRQSSSSLAKDAESSNEDGRHRCETLFQSPKEEALVMDAESSKVKAEKLRAEKQEELRALRERSITQRTSDGKSRRKSGHVEARTCQEPAMSPGRGTNDGLVGFGMFIKKSPSRPSRETMKPTARQEWRAEDDAQPSQLKRSSLKNKEMEELARLCNKGLAKQGSKKYAIFEKNSREAQLEHDAAAQDLALRKSHTSSYTYKGTKEINPVDAMYLDHQKWRKKTMKEEKEALGLFNEAPKHVDQEGAEGQVPTSYAKFQNMDGYQKWESGDRAVGDTSGKKEKKKWLGVKSSCGCTIM